MSAGKYLKAGFWQRVRLPLVGRLPLNVAALAGFGVAGFDHPVFWAVGAGWQVVWLAGTAGRAGFRRKVDAALRQEKWRGLEERRLQLYNQLPEDSRRRHHALRQSCHSAPVPSARGKEPDPAGELFLWLHLKLLLARHHAAHGRLPAGGDPDLAGLQAGAAVDLTDPAGSRLAEEALARLDPRHALAAPGGPVVPAMDEVLRRIEIRLGGVDSGPMVVVVEEEVPVPRKAGQSLGGSEGAEGTSRGVDES